MFAGHTLGWAEGCLIRKLRFTAIPLPATHSCSPPPIYFIHNGRNKFYKSEKWAWVSDCLDSYNGLWPQFCKRDITPKPWSNAVNLPDLQAILFPACIHTYINSKGNPNFLFSLTRLLNQTLNILNWGHLILTTITCKSYWKLKHVWG